MSMPSKTMATWLALLGGPLGLHRLYLDGRLSVGAALHWPPTLLGLWGVQRMRELGQDDRLAWVLIPLLGLMITQACLLAILYGLTPDETWQARRHPSEPVQPTRWGPVLGVVASLMVGATVLMATIAFVGQRFFETLAG